MEEGTIVIDVRRDVEDDENTQILYLSTGDAELAAMNLRKLADIIHPASAR